LFLLLTIDFVLVWIFFNLNRAAKYQYFGSEKPFVLLQSQIAHWEIAGWNL